MSIQLYATPNSHFARKNRILLTELDVPFELKWVPNLLSSNPSDFGGNPILRIPTFVHNAQWIVESDQISRYIVEQFDPHDRLGCVRLTPQQRNALSMMNAAMSAEVEILLSGRSGIADIRSYDYFRRYYEVIGHCLGWLEREGERIWTSEPFSYLDITLICMWQHLRFYGNVESPEAYPWIASRVAGFEERPSVASSLPKEL